MTEVLKYKVLLRSSVQNPVESDDDHFPNSIITVTEAWLNPYFHFVSSILYLPGPVYMFAGCLSNKDRVGY